MAPNRQVLKDVDAISGMGERRGEQDPKEGISVFPAEREYMEASKEA